MIATLSSTEKTGPIELGEVEIEAWGAVSGLGEPLLGLIRNHPNEEHRVTAHQIGEDREFFLGRLVPGWSTTDTLHVVLEICKLPAAKYRITAWPLVRVEYRETRFGEGAAPVAAEPIGRVIL